MRAWTAYLRLHSLKWLLNEWNEIHFDLYVCVWVRVVSQDVKVWKLKGLFAKWNKNVFTFLRIMHKLCYFHILFDTLL